MVRQRMLDVSSRRSSIVEKCITGYLMELWVTLFTGRGKHFAFPCVANRVIHDTIASYALFHDAIC